MIPGITRSVMIMALLFLAWLIGILTTLGIQDTMRHNLEQLIITDRPSIEIQP